MPAIPTEIPGFLGYYADRNGGVWSTWRLRGKPHGGRGTESYVGGQLRLLKPGKHEGGYKTYSLRRAGEYHGFLGHQLILLTFIGPCPEGLEGCHQNGNPQDNRLGNLYWGTRQQNMDDSVRLNTVAHGEGNAAHKLTKSEVLEVVDLLNAGMMQTEIAAKYGVTQATIGHIANGKTWRRLTEGKLNPVLGHWSKRPDAAEIAEKSASKNRGKQHTEEHKEAISEGVKASHWSKRADAAEIAKKFARTKAENRAKKQQALADALAALLAQRNGTCEWRQT